MLDIPCIIFAGGKSSRMGEDKSLLPFGEFHTLTEYQYSRLSQIFSKVYISCKSRNKFNFDANFIEDDNSLDIYAPTIGFLSIYKKLQIDRFFVLSVDSPFIDSKTIERLIDADRFEYEATVARTSLGIEPLCAIYHRSLESKFLTMYQESNYKLRHMLKSSHVRYVDFKKEDSFLNLNHPHEYKKALQLINS